MRKINFLFSIVSVFSLLMPLVRPVGAVSPTVSIQDLPEYTNSNNFKLSCSALGASTAQFSFRKEGVAAFTDFGPLINLNTTPCQVSVTSSQVLDQTKYYFKVTVDGGAASDETSTNYDFSGPSGVQNYWKERMGGSEYRLHWKNPGDSDFSRVFIYRGTEPGFPADGSHKIGELGGAPDAEMSWEDTGLIEGKEYFYALRAVDKADNSSSLVGDAGTVQGTTTVTQAQAPEGKVVFVPEEEGQVLPESTGEPVTTEEGPGELEQKTTEVAASPWVRWAVGILIGILAVWLLANLRKRD